MGGVRFLIRGRVQGVGYRWFVSREATQLRLRGRVRNLADGAVEVLVLGDAGAVEHLEAALRRGPPGASVVDVEKTELPHEVELPNSFEIN